MNSNFDWDILCLKSFIGGILYIDQQMLLIEYMKIHIIKHNSRYFIILLSTFISFCIEYTKIHGMSNVKFIEYLQMAATQSYRMCVALGQLDSSSNAV